MAERIFFAGAEQNGQPAVCGQLMELTMKMRAKPHDGRMNIAGGT
jgi:hypothetical protein